MKYIHSIASQLIEYVSNLPLINQETPDPILKTGSILLPYDEPEQYAEELVQKLERALTEIDWQPDSNKDQISPGENFSLGSTIRYAPIRQITRGFMEPVRIAPLVKRLPDLVALYIMSIPGGRDYLQRERHTVIGWHYHYLDAKCRRSNTILCWDTRWQPPVKTNASLSEDTCRPLFQERHGDGFNARPDLWRDPKKLSMYEACAIDLKRNISEFRCAANTAEVVWPPGKRLTPRPKEKAPLAKKANKKKR